MSTLSNFRNEFLNNSLDKLFERYAIQAINTISGKRVPNIDFDISKTTLMKMANEVIDLDSYMNELIINMTTAKEGSKIAAALALNEAIEDFIEYLNHGDDFIMDLNHNDIISRYVYYVNNDGIDYLPSCCTEEFSEFFKDRNVKYRDFVAFIIAVYELPIALSLLYCLSILG